jgi:hypothetical protein
MRGGQCTRFSHFDAESGMIDWLLIYPAGLLHPVALEANNAEI